jgi:ATP-dependent RNA helicase RhlE
MSFEQFNLDARLERALQRLGYETPTPIQVQAIPPALEGNDVLGVAQTGTGKTAAFVLPSLQRLLPQPSSTSGPVQPSHDRPRPVHTHGPRMIVLAPTRELALQIAEESSRLAEFTPLRVTVVYGGAPLRKQTEQLRKGTDVVVATPGRLMDHLDRGNLNFDGLQILVLDEADRMLDMGFLPDIESIVQRMPKERQTMLFSATMPGPIQALTYRFMRRPVRVEIENAVPPEALVQKIYPVSEHLKVPLLIALLREAAVESTLVFTRTKSDADVVTRKLREAGLSVAEMHGDFQQKERVKALDQFRQGHAAILVATNIAARGLDIEGISHVVNFDVPDEAEDYVHRIGRTARVQAEGVAWTLVTPQDEPQVSAIEYLLGKKIERVRLPDFDYAVPVPDWAKPSAKVQRRATSAGRGAIARWKSLTR